MKKSKEYHKSFRGITLIPLLITVTLMLIITGVAIRSGLQSADNAQLQSFFAELQIIQKRVDVISEEAKAEENDIIMYDASTKVYTSKIGMHIQDITEEEDKKKVENLVGNGEIAQYEKENYYYYTPEDLESLGIENISQNVLINWEIRDVVSVDGFTANGVTYYRDPSMQKTQYEEPKQEIVFHQDNIEITGEAIKQVKIVNLVNGENQPINDFEVRYRLKEEQGWTLAEGNQFKTAIPGTYAIQISNSQIQNLTIEKTLEAEFKVEQKQIGTNWQYTITQTFGEYKYQNVAYQYRIKGETEWTTITGDTFMVTEQKEYEIQAIDMDQLEKPIIGSITTTILQQE